MSVYTNIWDFVVERRSQLLFRTNAPATQEEVQDIDRILVELKGKKTDPKAQQALLHQLEVICIAITQRATMKKAL